MSRIALNTNLRPITLYPGGDASALYAQQQLDHARGRAVVYGLTDPAQVAAFASDGLELLFGSGYYRKGYAHGATPSALAGWTFARASVATAETSPGVVQHWSSGQPRIVPGKGLLVERSATNLLPRSQDFSHEYWSPVGAGVALAPVVVSNDAIAPDGTLTADRVTMTLDGGSSLSDISMLFSGGISTTPGQSYAASIWVRGTQGETILLRHMGNGAYLEHTFSGAWERIERVETAVADAGQFQIGLRGATASQGGLIFYLWGAQFEAGVARSSYIPTEGSTATRAADQASMGVGVGDATILWRGIAPSSVWAAGTLPSLFTAFGSAPQAAYAFIYQTLELVANTWDGSTVSSMSVASPVSLGQPLRVAFSFGQAAEDRAVSNGGTVATMAGLGQAYSLNEIRVGWGFSNPGPYQGWIDSVVVMPFRLDGPALQSLTA